MVTFLAWMGLSSLHSPSFQLELKLSHTWIWIQASSFSGGATWDNLHVPTENPGVLTCRWGLTKLLLGTLNGNFSVYIVWSQASEGKGGVGVAGITQDPQTSEWLWFQPNVLPVCCRKGRGGQDLWLTQYLADPELGECETLFLMVMLGGILFLPMAIEGTEVASYTDLSGSFSWSCSSVPNACICNVHHTFDKQEIHECALPAFLA